MEAQNRETEASLLVLAEEVFGQTYLLARHMKQNSVTGPSLAPSTPTELWTSASTEIQNTRENILGLIKQLRRLLYGPHGFMHEYVSTNWEYGALYTVLEFDVLEKIPLDGEIHISQLAEKSGLPADKLLNVLRLTACERIVDEVSNGVFGHTAISKELVEDKGFKAFIAFQLFETRVASAHLADSLRKGNGYWTGMSAFEYAWGQPMSEWHQSHPAKGSRFAQAMQSVANSLDPANKLLCDWFEVNESKDKALVVDVGGGTGQTSRLLAERFPNLSFDVRDSAQNPLDSDQETLGPELATRIRFTQCSMFDPPPLEDSERVFAYVLRHVLWNLPDEDCIKFLRSFMAVLEKAPQTVILINELLSPEPKTFAPHVEAAYRRRDVTLMTMHNVKPRTQAEWRDLFTRASPHFKAEVVTGSTSHTHRGLWEVRWDASPRQLS